jgi:hypothetical protein
MPLVRRLRIQDEGTTQGAASTINFAGAGVTAAVSGGVATATIAGGGVGSTVSGQAIIDFGAFPGASDASVAVASAGISAGSIITASLAAVATSDHSADEHVCEDIEVIPGAPNAGVGFTLYARLRSHPTGLDSPFRRGQNNSNAGNTLAYGQWTVNWSYT